MAATNLNRLSKEYADLMSKGAGLEGTLSDAQRFLLGPSNKDDMAAPWICVLRGPPGSPYEGGTFRVSISIPKGYPFGDHPSITFGSPASPAALRLTPLWHPLPDPASGNVCLGADKKWAPASKLESLPPVLLGLLEHPSGENAANLPAAEQLAGNQAAFVAKAQEWARLHGERREGGGAPMCRIPRSAP